MPDEERLRLLPIAERLALLKTWIGGLAEEDFVGDLKARDAAAMSLLVIGKTSRRLLPETKARAPDISWSAIVSLRNRIAHGYETVDHRLVWQILIEDMPTLARVVDEMLGSS